MATNFASDTRPSSEVLRQSDDTNEEEKLGFLSNERKFQRAAHGWSTRFLVGTGLNVLLFCVSCALYGSWYYETHVRMNAALKRSNTYSPVYDQIDLEMGPQKLNGTLFYPKEPSIARQLPNDAADAVWDEWELARYIPITANQIRAMGKDPSTVAKLADEDWGLGDDAYVGTFDIYHELHCVNSLRRIVYGEYYNETRGTASGKHRTKKGEMWEVHINHCIDMLVQTLKCSGNLNLITMHYVAEQEYPAPDMSINRQCINFDKLTDWRKDNSIDMTKYLERMKKKEGQKELPAPDDFYVYYAPDKVNPNHLNGANPGEDFNM